MEPEAPRRLLSRQFPKWPALPLRHVETSGTDNNIWRLGEELCVRMPKVAWAADSVARECKHMPRLLHLPLAIPKVVARGEPDEGYSYVWSVCTWIEGDAARLDALRNPETAGRELAKFVLTLQAQDSTGGPRPSKGNNLRGGPLRFRDAATRKAIENLAGHFDACNALEIWSAALAARPYEGDGVWIHGDLKEDNLLMRDGQLSAVIDFGMLAVGDPAVDLVPAWSFFGQFSRWGFLSALRPDTDTLARAKGWALSIAVIAWDYYRDRNPALTGISQRTLRALMSGN